MMKKFAVIKYGFIFSLLLIGIVSSAENSLTLQSIVPGFVAVAQTHSGAELFKANCARCHGEDAKGGRGPDLTAAKRQNKWKDSDEKLVKKITSGGLFMPKFGNKLKPEEIKAVANYVRSLKPE